MIDIARISKFKTLGIVTNPSDSSICNCSLPYGKPRTRSRRENDGSGAIIQGRITYLTFLMAMMKKQPMMARAMAVGKAKL